MYSCILYNAHMHNSILFIIKIYFANIIYMRIIACYIMHILIIIYYIYYKRNYIIVIVICNKYISIYILGFVTENIKMQRFTLKISKSLKQ